MILLETTTYKDWELARQTFNEMSEQLQLTGREISLIEQLLTEAMRYRASKEIKTEFMFNESDFAAGVKPPGALF